jgi:hypothetical protein
VQSASTSSGPVKVELTQPSAVNLAQQIGKQTKQGQPGTPQPRGIIGRGIDMLTGPWKRMATDMGIMKPAAAKAEAPTLPGWMSQAKPIDILGQRKKAQEFDLLAGTKYAKPGAEPLDATRKMILDVEKGKAGSTESKGWMSFLKSPGPAPKTPAAGIPSKATGIAATAGKTGAEEMATAMGAAAGAVGGFVVASAAVGIELISVEKGLQAFTQGVVDGNEHLRKWNGELAVAQARLEVGDIKREIHTAGATGSTAASAATELNNLKDEFQPLSEGISNVVNLLAGAAADVGILVTWVIRFGTVIGPLLEFLNWSVKPKPSEAPLKGLMDMLQARMGNAGNFVPAAKVGARAQRPGGAGGAPGPGVGGGITGGGA